MVALFVVSAFALLIGLIGVRLSWGAALPEPGGGSMMIFAPPFFCRDACHDQLYSYLDAPPSNWPLYVFTIGRIGGL